MIHPDQRLKGRLRQRRVLPVDLKPLPAETRGSL
jgi:hypothetical protein